MRVPERKPKQSYPWPWPKVRLRVLQEMGWRCELCGGRAEQVDHKVPFSDRPDLVFERSNLQAVCTKCNLRKELQRREWAKRIDRRPANRRVW